ASAGRIGFLSGHAHQGATSSDSPPVQVAVFRNNVAVLRADGLIDVFAGRQSVNTYSPDGARAIALRAGELVVLTKRQTIDVFSRADGSLLHSWRIPRGPARTVDVHFGVAVFTIGQRAFALRLSNGRIAPLVKTPGAVAAQIDDCGVVSRSSARGQGYLGFIPFATVERKLG